MIPMRFALLLLMVTLSGCHAPGGPPRDTASSTLRQRCLAILHDGLRSDAFWPAMHAAEALTRAGQGDVVAASLGPRLAQETDDQRRCGLARELIRAGETQHIPVLVGVLADPDSNGHAHAAESLFKVGHVGDPERLRMHMVDDPSGNARVYAAAALAAGGDSEALGVIREALVSGEPRRANQAAFVLTWLGGPDDIPALRRRLAVAKTDRDRRFAAHALAVLGDDDGLAALAKNLNHDDPGIRASAAEAAGYANAQELSPTLLRLLSDSILDVRIRAAQALQMLSETR